MVLAAVSWAMGTVAVKRFDWSLPTTSLIGWQLLIGAVPITAGALILEPFPNVFALSDRVLWASVYVFLIPMVFCQWAFIKMVRLFPASIAAIGTLAIPVVGVYSSAVVLGEPAGLLEFVSLLLICAALLVVLVAPALRPTRAAP